jgi:hypothetical protein
MACCNIIGLGPSLKSYRPDGNFSIGCNDCFRSVETDYLVCVSRLPTERSVFVQNARPKKLLSMMPIYKSHPCYEYIGNLHPWKEYRPNNITKGMVFFSNNTPFIACSIAYNLGYREIVLWGVDFTDHPHLNGGALNKTVVDFDQLQKEFEKNNASMYLGCQGSILNLNQWR